MASDTATRAGTVIPAVFRGVLLSVVLVAGVVLGLVGMHTLNLHGTAAAEAPAAVSASDPGHAEAHPAGMTSHEVGQESAGGQMSCAGCGTDEHAGMAMVCVLALLLLLLLVAPPHLLREWTRVAVRSPLGRDAFLSILTRGPSLHVLCISRT